MEAIGQIVKAEYKTGQYIARIVEQDRRRTLVEVLAVLKHPTQGDLHSSYDPDAAMFHERRASAEREKLWVMETVPFNGEVPAYKDSLANAWQAEVERMDRMKRWAERCLIQLNALGADYGLTK